MSPGQIILQLFLLHLQFQCHSGLPLPPSKPQWLLQKHFHRHEEPKDRHSTILFSVANVLAPGTFEPAGMDALSSPGIAMFMRLPGPEHPADAFQQMLDAAKSLAQELDGKVCDESRSTLTPQSINHLRERIADFGRRQMIKA